jgi:hypothetical protein
MGARLDSPPLYARRQQRQRAVRRTPPSGPAPPRRPPPRQPYRRGASPPPSAGGRRHRRRRGRGIPRRRRRWRCRRTCGARRGGGGALLRLDVVLLADGLVGHGRCAAPPLLSVGALAPELLRYGRHPRRRAGSPRTAYRRRGRGPRVWTLERAAEVVGFKWWWLGSSRRGPVIWGGERGAVPCAPQVGCAASLHPSLASADASLWLSLSCCSPAARGFFGCIVTSLPVPLWPARPPA